MPYIKKKLMKFPLKTGAMSRTNEFREFEDR
jgi:hypothetical protein